VLDLSHLRDCHEFHDMPQTTKHTTHKMMPLAMAIGLMATVAPVARAATEGAQAEAVRYRTEGLELQQQGDLQGAIAKFQSAIRLDDQYAAPHNDLGIAYEMLSRPYDAEQAYAAALALDPSYVRAHTNLAILFEQQGQMDLAANHWQKRYRLGPQNDHWGQVARTWLEEHGYGQVVHAAETPVVSVMPDQPEESKVRASTNAELPVETVEASEAMEEMLTLHSERQRADDARRQAVYNEGSHAVPVSDRQHTRVHLEPMRAVHESARVSAEQPMTAQESAAYAPPPLTPKVQERMSPARRLTRDKLQYFDAMLGEFEDVTDPDGTEWVNRPYSTRLRLQTDTAP
jgi:tetratricopeptide (TPR) repeat protein